jgi:hypothetical protein
LGLHWYVFNNLKRVLRRDYVKTGKRLIRGFLVLFVLMDVPFFFLWFQGSFHATLTLLNHIIIYPFLVWQTIMLMWAVILFPFTLFRRTRKMIWALKRKRTNVSIIDQAPELAMEALSE